MPASITPINARCRGEYVRLQWCPPGGPAHDIGILLLDTLSNQSQLRLRGHWEDIADANDIEYLASLEADFRGKMSEMDAQRFLESLEDSLSHILRVTDRESVAGDSYSRVADRLFEKYVEPIPVERYGTHLPLYTLRAAAGKFGADEAVEEEDWVRAPEGMRLTGGMFVAHVVGRSMEPRIPDGSLNIFRAPVLGSRQGKIVLVEVLGVDERYTVKRYTSRKAESGEGWQHQAIRLEPLNPEFEPLDLAPDRLRVVAEWVRTLE